MNFDSINKCFVKIPSGRILLREEKTRHKWKVEIRPFLIDVYPVTQDLYFAMTGKKPSTFQGERNPVENVSWNDAVEFCNLFSQQAGLNECYSINTDKKDVVVDWEADGYRLPSEAEWEFACRAGSSEVRYGEIAKIAWYHENSDKMTNEVGKKKLNAWGLYDTLGNVWEWCWDVYDEKIYGDYKVFRGGGWNDPENSCRASCRRRSHPTYQIDDLGFRLVRSLA
jgi:formylglycine-generating enzyme required for sulfatase activity